MNLTPKKTKKGRLIVIFLVLVIASLTGVFSFLSGRVMSRNLLNQLKADSQSLASAVSSQKVMELDGLSSDEFTSAYKELKKQLANIKMPHTNWRNVYLAGQRDGEGFLYVDSEEPGDPDYSSAGEAREVSDAFKNIFVSNEATYEGPIEDNGGVYISGLAPIFSEDDERVVAILGINAAASTYWREVVIATAMPILIGIIIILGILSFDSVRRRNDHLNELRAELVSVASHDLKNLIIGIRWASESLGKLVRGDQQAEQLVSAIHKNAVNLEVNTQDILDFNKQANTDELKLELYDLRKIVQDVYDTQTLNALHKGVTLYMDGTWPEVVTVRCDADQFKWAFQNIVGNAIKYTREHTLVRLSYRLDSEGHHIYVTDQGIGVPLAEQNQVFTGFYRATNAKLYDVEGTGLGLYLVKTIMERHGGSVSLSSKENVGTTVELILPS